MSKLRITISFVAMAMGAFLLFSAHPYFMGKYMRESPRVMNVETGNVYPFFQHGVTVFMSMHQNFVLYGILGLALLSFLICAIAFRPITKMKNELKEDRGN